MGSESPKSLRGFLFVLPAPWFILGYMLGYLMVLGVEADFTLPISGFARYPLELLKPIW